LTAGDVYRALWRHRFFILLLTAAFVIATWYATSQQTKIYEASTLVRVQQRISDPGDALGSLEAASQLAETYGTIIDSGALDAQVSAGLASRGGEADAGSLDLSGEPVVEQALLWISARDEDPATAALVANTVPRTLRAFISSTGTLQDQLVIIKTATEPTSLASPDLGLNLVLALALALIFNSALVLLFELFRDRVPETDELQEALGYPVLATIPGLHLRKLTMADSVSADQANGSRAGWVSDSRDATGDRELERHPER
jgi:capsular polysaccharide biosynthesis protein